MALQVCKECTTAYAPAAKCPHCGHDQWVPEHEADVKPEPKATRPAAAARHRPRGGQAAK